jgi:ribosomal protein L7/L12
MGLFSDPTIAARLSAIERKLDIIMDSLGLKDPVQAPPSVMEEIQDLVRAGRKIDAIKIYRERTGVGLAEAKAAIDRV